MNFTEQLFRSNLDIAFYYDGPHYGIRKVPYQYIKTVAQLDGEADLYYAGRHIGVVKEITEHGLKYFDYHDLGQPVHGFIPFVNMLTEKPAS